MILVTPPEPRKNEKLLKANPKCSIFWHNSDRSYTSLYHARTKINRRVQACSSGPYVIVTSKRLARAQTTHVSEYIKQPPLTTNKEQNSGLPWETWRDDERSPGQKLTFCWSSWLSISSSLPGVPELSEKNSDQLLCHCLVVVLLWLFFSSWHSRQKRMTLSEVKINVQLPHPAA